MNIKNLNWHVTAVFFLVAFGVVTYVLHSNQKKMLELQKVISKEAESKE